MSTKRNQTYKQLVFRDMVLGTLLYSVVLGFFNDYTSILYTRSYSITFTVAIVMQLLTYATFLLKDRVVHWFRKQEGSKYQIGMVFCVWLILFLSKFVFLEVIDLVFGQSVEISGFIGLLLIIICLTVAQKIVEIVTEKLGD